MPEGGVYELIHVPRSPERSGRAAERDSWTRGVYFYDKKDFMKKYCLEIFFRRFGKVGMAQNQHFGGNPLFNLTREIWVLGHAHFSEPLKKYFQTIFFYEIFFIIKVYISTCA